MADLHLVWKDEEGVVQHDPKIRARVDGKWPPAHREFEKLVVGALELGECLAIERLDAPPVYPRGM